MMRTATLLGATLAFVAVSTAPVTGQEQAVIVVVGAPGTTEYANQFARWAESWEQACSKSNVTCQVIGLDEENALSDRARLDQTLGDQARRTVPALWLVLLGHGTFDGRTAKFNLRGRDISANDLAHWLKPIRSPVAIVNTASSSAPFLKALSGPNRVIITATKSGFEQNFTRFGQYLTEAIIEPEADLDKDGQTSLLEAYLTASHRTSEFYAAGGRLATEHALLDDNGDALGTPADWFRGIRPVQRASDNASLDGYRAHQFHLRYSEAEARIPASLRAKRNRLELEVMKLRDAQAQIPEETYFSKLEDLLVEIAQVYETIEDANGT